GAASGLVAGLVAITPASGYVAPMPAIVLGLLAGVLCYTAVTIMKSVFRLDDTLDAFGVHGVGGAWGAIATGLFASVGVNPLARTGLLATDVGGFGYNAVGMALLVDQLAAVGIVAAYTFVVTLGVLKIVDMVVGLRVSEQVELQGLDVHEHGEHAYHYEPAAEPTAKARAAKD
ncbi:MAG TPA: ammonia channel protein, partial [Candidatus Thermoplasmatota archaeon]|nr:ammonia channel protein [Candidatus Thermoplasmatota archaeon]